MEEDDQAENQDGYARLGSGEEEEHELTLGILPGACEGTCGYLRCWSGGDIHLLHIHVLYEIYTSDD